MSRPATEPAPRHDVVIEKMAAGGDGLAHLPDGRVAFVNGGVTGETVTVSLTASKKDFARAVVRDVVQASPHRIAPPCPAVAAGCGGCGWQHIDHPFQPQLKVAIVVDALRRTAKRTGDDVAFAGAVPPWAYRTSARLAVGPGGRLGFRAASSHRAVLHGECAVLHPLLSSLLGELRVSGAEEVSLRVGVASGERSLWADSPAARVTGCDPTVQQGPRSAVHERIGEVTLRVSAESFFQSGPEAAGLLVDTVRTLVPDVADLPGVVDAYGGVGLFSAGLGLRRPVLVESSASSCADAEVNLLTADAEIHCTTLEEWTPQPAPLVIADPARAGLGRHAVDVLAATGASRFVLVSCDPVAFARDVTLLGAHGYDLAQARVLDLFPQTAHVEVVGLFFRAGVSSAIASAP
jgi:23S rRNA (uracil1939-C5)-methyltransferase